MPWWARGDADRFACVKVFAVLAGALVVVAYAVWGMVVINNLGLVAGSGLPLDETLAAMELAEQPASMIPGYVFLIVGLATAAFWALNSLLSRRRSSTQVVVGWCVALTLGAPFLFSSGFWNLNSLGDTFYDWHMEAVAALERPLYLVSGLSLIVLVLLGVWRFLRRSEGRHVVRYHRVG